MSAVRYLAELQLVFIAGYKKNFRLGPEMSYMYLYIKDQPQGSFEYIGGI